MSIEEKKFFSCICSFTEDLTNLNVDPLTKTKLNFVIIFLNNTTDIKNVIRPMYNFIIKNKDEIKNKNDFIFKNFEAKTGDIKHILNIIKDIWQQIKEDDKTRIWEWMKTLLDFCEINQNFIDK